jgi:hypothetical protein
MLDRIFIAIIAKTARHRSLPHCHACGYDMRDRAAGDPCPECAAPFDTRPDAPGSYTRSMTMLVCLSLSIVVVPFVLFPIWLVLWVIAYANERGIQRSLPGHRLPHRVKRRLHIARWLSWVSVAAWFGMMFIHFVRPDLLNWW